MIPENNQTMIESLKMKYPIHHKFSAFIMPTLFKKQPYFIFASEIKLRGSFIGCHNIYEVKTMTCVHIKTGEIHEENSKYLTKVIFQRNPTFQHFYCLI